MWFCSPQSIAGKIEQRELIVFDWQGRLKTSVCVYLPDIPLQSIKKESLKWRIANYGFREMTYDIDAVITASSARMEAVNAVGDRLSLPNG